MPQYGWTCQKSRNPQEIMSIYFQSTAFLGLSTKVVSRVECVWWHIHSRPWSLLHTWLKRLQSSSSCWWVPAFMFELARWCLLQPLMMVSKDNKDWVATAWTYSFTYSCMWELVVSGSQLDLDVLVVNQLEPDWSSARKPVCITFILQFRNNRSTTCPET